MNAYVYVMTSIAVVLRGEKNPFFVIQEAVDEQTAVTLCSNNLGVIASLHGADDYNDAKASCESAVSGSSNTGCWVGLRQGDEWYNEDGTELGDYLFNTDDSPKTGVAPWGLDQPDPSLNQPQPDCVHIAADNNYQLFDDENCDNSNLPVCECHIDDALEQCSNIITDIDTRIAENRFFVIGDESVDEPTAELLCLERGGTIASFHSDEEYDVAKALCASADVDSNLGCWTGIKEDETIGIYYNEDGSDTDYMLNSDGSAKTGIYPWASGRPNDAGTNHCNFMHYSYEYMLDDRPCTEEKLPICRYNVSIMADAIADLSTRIDNLQIVDGVSAVAVFGFDPIPLIMGLLMVNVFTIILAVWCCYSMQKRPKYQAVKAIYSSDEQYQENIQLK